MINKFLVSSAFLAILSCMTSLANADVLADWDFSGLDYTSNGLATNDLAPNPILTADKANALAGLSTSDMTPSENLRVVVNANTMAGEADLRDFDSGGDGTNDQYFEFLMTADTAGTLNVDSISISEWRNGGGAANGMAFDVSVNGGDFSLYDSVMVDDNAGDFGFDTFTFNQTITGADTVAVRFTPRNAGGGSTGNLHINGLAVNGTISAVPEPTSLTILGVFGTAVLLRRRK